MCNWNTDYREIAITRRVVVDGCIADWIRALNDEGIYTTGSCCGHGEEPATATIEYGAIFRAEAAGYAVRWTGDAPGWGQPYVTLEAP